MTISDYERLLWVFAEEQESSIRSCMQKATQRHEWVNGIDEANALTHRFRGVFVASIVGEIEEKIGRAFSSTLDQLPSAPTRRESEYWFNTMPETSSPKGRAQAMWAVRIAFTHGNGRFSQISDPNVTAFLREECSRLHFAGLEVVDDQIRVGSVDMHPAIKTALEIWSRFGA